MDLQAIRNFTKSDLEDLLLDKTAEAKPLPFSLLAEITNDFSYKQEIGRGGFAVVYKGILDNGAVAVKRLSNSYMYEDQFVREVQCLVKVKHTNIVRFLGYCSEAQGNAGTYKGKFTIADIQERLLCFEYLPEGSLDYYIKDPSGGLAWNSRYHILKGICKGLHYLHSTNVLHLDLKPQNILMGDNMIPKITDFGLSRVLDETQTRISATTMFGTEGYLAPESKSHEITSKFDLYSLGVIIMEILTGKKDRQIVDKVLERWGNRLDLSEGNPDRDQIRVCAEIGFECTDLDPTERPVSMTHIMDRLAETEKEVLESWGNRLDLSEGNPETEKETIQPSIQIIEDTTETISSIDANQTEPLIITGHYGGYVKIWNYDTQSQKMVASIKVSEKDVFTVKFIARKRWLVAVSADCFIHVYKYEKEPEMVTSFEALCYHEIFWCSSVIHPTQPYVLSGCGPKIRLWDWDQDWNCIQTFEEHWGDIKELKFNLEDTNSFASASDDYTVKVWSLDSPKSKYTLSGHSDWVHSVDFFKRDGQQYLISGSRDMTAKIWDMQKEECVHTLEHEFAVRSVLSHANLPVLVTGTWSGAVHVWSSTDFRLKTIPNFVIDEVIRGFACLMGSGRVAIASYEGVWVIEIGDEEGQGGSEVSNDISIATAD